jgi:hypothetical protein
MHFVTVTENNESYHGLLSKHNSEASNRYAVATRTVAAVTEMFLKDS